MSDREREDERPISDVPAMSYHQRFHASTIDEVELVEKRRRRVKVAGLGEVDFQRLHGPVSFDILGQQLAQAQASVLTGGAGRFSCADLIGQGGQGMVLLVEDHDCRRRIALKTFKSPDPPPYLIARFIHEAQVTAQLEHPGIVPVHDLNTLPDGSVYYTMKCIDGLPLSEYLDGRRGREDQRYDLLRLFIRICEPLAFAHAKGVLHRDVKPLNIMVGDYGEVLIVDWGLSKLLDGSEVVSSRLEQRSSESDDDPDPADFSITREGSALGTMSYMSPEQARGDLGRLDQRTDLYALGVILYEMLSGESPYGQPANHRALMERVIGGTWQPLGDTLPRPLVAIVHKCLALDPDERYETVDQLIIDIEHFLANQSVLAYEESLFERLYRWSKRNRQVIRTAAVSFGLLVAIGVGLVFWLQEHRHERRRLLIGEARELVAGNELGEALSRYDRILEWFPDDRDIHRRRAELQQQLQEQQEAEQLRQRRQRAVEKLAEAENLAASSQRDELERALQLCAESIGLQPQEQAYQLRQQIRTRLDERQASLLLEEAEGLIDDDAIDGAAAKLERAQNLVPANALIKDLQQRIDAARQARELATRQRRAQALWDRARTHAETGDLAQAVVLMNAAIEVENLAGATEALVSYSRQLAEAEAADERRRQRAAADDEIAAARQALASGERARARMLVARAELFMRDHPAIAPLRERIDAADRAADRVAAESAASALLQRAADAEHRSLDLRQDLHGQRQQLTQIDQEIHARPRDTGLRRRRRQAAAAVADLEEQRAQALQETTRFLHAAQQQLADHKPTLDALARFYRDRVLEEAAVGNREQVAALAEIGRSFDREGRYQAVFDGIASISASVESVPLTASRLSSFGQPAEAVSLLPGQPVAVPFGRYLLQREDGTRAARRFSRGAQKHDIALPPHPELPESCIFVPPGPVYNRDGRIVTQVDEGFALGRYEITNGEWRDFLNHEETWHALVQERAVDRPQWYPRRFRHDEESLWHRRRGAGNRWIYELRVGGKAIPANAPISGISRTDVEAYIAWRRQQDGIAWRLPTVYEWQSAAQSGDGRLWTWGDDSDLSRCCSGFTVAAAEVMVQPVGSFSDDRSEQGAHDLAGSVSEWVQGTSPRFPDAGYVLGGSWRELEPDRCSTWFVQVHLTEGVSPFIGFRVACDLVDGQLRRVE